MVGVELVSAPIPGFNIVQFKLKNGLRRKSHFLRQQKNDADGELVSLSIPASSVVGLRLVSRSRLFLTGKKKTCTLGFVDLVELEQKCYELRK